MHTCLVHKMDELVDELSGTTLDGDANHKDFPMKAKNNKPVNRTASIINRSKMLMLSDSESEADEEMGPLDKRRCSKHLRLSKQRSSAAACSWRVKSSSYSKMLSKGKRKRNSTTEMLLSAASTTSAAHSNNLFAAGPSGLQSERFNNKSDSMDVECDQFDEEGEDSSSDESDLSEESPTECNFDGDDEQSDFYDSTTTNGSHHQHATQHRHRNRIYCHSRPKLEFKIPSNPSNPFWSVVDLEPHHNNNLWKRRRPLH